MNSTFSERIATPRDGNSISGQDNQLVHSIQSVYVGYLLVVTALEVYKNLFPFPLPIKVRCRSSLKQST